MKIVIIGAGTTALAVADILVQDKNFSIAGFIGTPEENKVMQGENIYKDLPFIGDHHLLKLLVKDGIVGFIVAIGNCDIKEKYYYEAELLGLEPVNAISRDAIIKTSVTIGKGIIINSGSIISHGVVIGNNTHLDLGTIVDIGSEISENCTIQSGTIIGGKSKIGRNVYIGSSCNITSSTNIGKNNQIEDGTVVRKNIGSQIRKGN